MTAILKLLLVWLLTLCCITSIAAQQKDSDTLSLSGYLQQVVAHHPAARAAALLQKQGRMEVRSARGFFDPILSADFNEKQFNDKTYFSIFNAETKVNTRLGVGFKTGYEYSRGSYLNPEHTLPENGLWYAGISVPLIQGLLFDEGRSLLRQAKIRQERYEVEQRLVLADLLFEATVAYWQWATQQQQTASLQQALAVATQRFSIVQGAFTTGELPAIDTLEAFLQLQTLQSQLLEEQQELIKATQVAATFAWKGEDEAGWEHQRIATPLPPTRLSDSLRHIHEEQLQQWSLASPAVLLYEFKQAELEAQRRLKAEKLKPALVASYNILSGTSVVEASEYSLNQYKLGLNFKLPLLLRTARGDLQLARLKLQAASLEQQQKQLEVRTKLEALLANLQRLEQQIQLYQELTEGYRQLWLGEQQKFTYGESTLFYVNSRELKYLESQQKLLSLQLKFLEQEASLKRLQGFHQAEAYLPLRY